MGKRKAKKALNNQIEKTARVAERDTQEQEDNDYHYTSSIADLAAAITKGEVGWGHSIDYWQQDKDSPGAEVFANITALMARNDSKLEEAIEAIAPNTFKIYKSKLDEYK